MNYRLLYPNCNGSGLDLEEMEYKSLEEAQKAKEELQSYFCGNFEIRIVQVIE